MQQSVIKFTVFFEEPFWVGVIEKRFKNQLSVAKCTFGQEPKEQDLNEFIQTRFYDFKFSSIVDEKTRSYKLNPKRRQRKARQETAQLGIGTKSQQALKQQHDENKNAKVKLSKEMKESRQNMLFELKQQKRKEKHRGR